MSITRRPGAARRRRLPRRPSAVRDVDRRGRPLARRAVRGGGRGPDPAGLALVAVGGYGRGELSLQSDIDVLLLHEGRDDIGELADRLWYPIWDDGLKLGHAVRTVKEALALAADDLDTATGLLQVRHLAGDRRLTDELAGQGRAAVAQAGQALAGHDVGPGARPARPVGRGGLPARARPQGGPGRAARRPRPAVGAGRPLDPVGRRPRQPRRRPTRPCSPCGSSCTAGPGVRATSCCSRSRTAWPTRSATPTPTR